MEFFIAWAIISLTNINSFFGSTFWGLFLFILVVGSFGLTIHGSDIEYSNDDKKAAFGKFTGKCIKGAITVIITAFICTTIVPSKKDAAYIFGIGLGLKAMNNEQMQKVPDNAARLINAYLEEAADSLPKIKKDVDKPVESK